MHTNVQRVAAAKKTMSSSRLSRLMSKMNTNETGGGIPRWLAMRRLNSNNATDTIPISEEEDVNVQASPHNHPRRKSNCWKYTRRGFITIVGITALVIAIIALLRQFPTSPFEDITGTWLTPGPNSTAVPLQSQGKIGQYYLDSGTQVVWYKAAAPFSGFQYITHSFSSLAKRAVGAAADTGAWVNVTDGNRLGGDLSGTIRNGTVQKVGGFTANYVAQGAALAYTLNSTFNNNGTGYVLPFDIPANSIVFPAVNASTARIAFTGPFNLGFDDSAGGPITVNFNGNLLRNGVPVGNVYAPLTAVDIGTFAFFESQNQLGFTNVMRIGPGGSSVIINGTLNAQNVTIGGVSFNTYIEQAVNESVSNLMPNETVIRQIVTEIVQNITLSPNATEVAIIVNQILANYTFNPNVTLIEEIVNAALANYTFNPNATLIQEIVLNTLANYTFNPNITLLNELIYQALLTINVTIPPPNVTLIREIVDEELQKINITVGNFTLPERLVYGPLVTPIASGRIPYFFDTSGRNITDSSATYFPGNNSYSFTALTANSLIASSFVNANTFVGNSVSAALVNAATISGATITASSSVSAPTITATGALSGNTISATTSITGPVITASTQVSTPLIIATGNLTLNPTGSSILFSNKNALNLGTITSSISGSAAHAFTMTGAWNAMWLTNGGTTGNLRFQTAGPGNQGFVSIAFNGGNTDAGEQRDNISKNRYRLYSDQRGSTDNFVIDVWNGVGPAAVAMQIGPTTSSLVSFPTGITTRSVTAQNDVTARNINLLVSTGAALSLTTPLIVPTNTGPHLFLAQHYSTASGNLEGTKIKMFGDAYGIGMAAGAMYFVTPLTAALNFHFADTSGSSPVTTMNQFGITTERVFANQYDQVCEFVVVDSATPPPGWAGSLRMRLYKAGRQVHFALLSSAVDNFRCTAAFGCGVLGLSTNLLSSCPGYEPFETISGIYQLAATEVPPRASRVAITPTGFLQFTCLWRCTSSNSFDVGPVVDAGGSLIVYYRSA